MTHNWIVKIPSNPASTDIQRIAFFMKEGGQTVPGFYHEFNVTEDEAREFVLRLQEEVDEAAAGVLHLSDAETVDAFLDAAYAAFTGAIRIAGVEKAQKCWEAIVRANESKVDGTFGEKVQDPDTGKILKPNGWKHPDIEGILNG